MGRMESTMACPDIRLPSLEITAAMAQPEGILTWPSNFISFHPFHKE